MRFVLRALAVVCFAAMVGTVLGDDVYYRVPLSRAATAQSPIPEPKFDTGADRERSAAMRPYAVVDGGEAYVAIADDSAGGRWWAYSWSPSSTFITVRAPAGAPVKGTVFVPDEAWNGLVARPFTIEASDAPADEAKRAFFQARLAHAERLLDDGVPGAAFYRWRADATRRELEMDDAPAPRVGAREMSDTYDLFSGGQAVSENLQLYREMPNTPAAAPDAPEVMVKLSSVPGITVPEFDWKSKLTNPTPDLGALSAAIPADQHAVFFPNFAALMTMLDEAGNEALPLARMAGPRSEDAMLVQRYERQLCLSRTAISRLLGPQAIKSVAITGSDPYYPTGTDVAVIFHAVKADGLRQVLLMQVKAAAQVAGAKTVSGAIDSIEYEGAVTDDRSISSYVAAIGDNVVVTNSLAQLKCLAAVKDQNAPSLASLPEFKYFRTRYAVSNADETAFIFLSDATIRRWCGAEWRIAASRRMRAAAIMADVTAAHAGEIVAGVKEARDVTAETPMRTIGTLRLGPSGVSSSVYGHASFMTPIRELALTEVPKDEATAYGRWRDGYQRNWSWAFDPIAISLSVTKEKLGADMTVMPLIGNSDYRQWVGMSQGVSIAKDAGDPHETLAHAVVAINTESPTVKNYAGMTRMFAPQIEIDPLGWLGTSVALYADPDPFWKELAAAESPMKFFEREAYRLPVALHADVGSALKLTAFVSAVRGFVEQSSPGMTAWETKEHNGRSYVKVGLSPTARQESRGGEFDKVCVYYAPTPRALVVTLSEDLLKRSLDRMGAAKDGAAKGAPVDAGWLGSSLCLRVAKEGLEMVRGTGRPMLRSQAQVSAWSNLETLNEWRRMFPGKDPVAVHRTLWGATPVCPGGGTYVWNEKFATMESTVYGHPGEPKDGPDLPRTLDVVESGDFGLTFEDGGLRARAVVKRRPE